MKKRVTTFLCALVLAACALSLVACGGYDVTLPIGDGNVENDGVIAEYHIDDVLTDGYKLKVTFKAESAANLNRKFTFSICNADPIFGKDYRESVLVTFDGSKLENGDYKVDIEIKLDNCFEKTETEKPFFIVLHDDVSPLGLTNCNSSEYKYTYKGDKLNITKD